MNKEFRDWLESEIQHLEDIKYASVVEFGIQKKLERVIKKYDELNKPVVIPKYVAEYLEFAKSDVPLKRVMEIANVRGEWPKWRKEYDWISANDETFARAWLDGYEVEEQKYVIKLPMSTGRDMEFALVDYEGDIWVDAWPNKYELTEQEIRALPKGDVYFEYFAEPVEEMEE